MILRVWRVRPFMDNIFSSLISHPRRQSEKTLASHVGELIDEGKVSILDVSPDGRTCLHVRYSSTLPVLESMHQLIRTCSTPYAVKTTM